MLLKTFYLFFIVSIYSTASAMKIEYKQDDCEEEYHTGVNIFLGNNDINPNTRAMESNYNRLGAAIVRGASEDKQRDINVFNIKENNLNFVRALMRKTHEIAIEREIPLTLLFYKPNKEKHDVLSREWEPCQQEIDKFYVNPWSKFLSGEDYYSD